MLARCDTPDMLLHYVTECITGKCEDCSQKINCDIMSYGETECFDNEYEELMLYTEGEYHE
jgi:hypothetical protein